MALLALAALAGCASNRPVDWRVQVRAVTEWPDLNALGDRVAQIGGVPVAVGDTVAIAPGWYALTLKCEDRAACKHAMMKLAAEPALFLELRRDETRRVPPTPTASANR